MTTKTCNKCNKILDLSKFPLAFKAENSTAYSAQNTPTYKNTCKPCLAIEAKKYRDSRPGLWKNYVGKNKGKGKITRYPLEDRALISAISNKITNAKQRIRRNPDLIVELDKHELYLLFKKQEGKCALTGTGLSLKKHTPLNLSIDKIDPSKGYVMTNVQWVCWAVNRAKGDLSMNDFIGMCKAVTRTCNDYSERK